MKLNKPKIKLNKIKNSTNHVVMNFEKQDKQRIRVEQWKNELHIK